MTSEEIDAAAVLGGPAEHPEAEVRTTGEEVREIQGARGAAELKGTRRPWPAGARSFFVITGLVIAGVATVLLLKARRVQKENGTRGQRLVATERVERRVPDLKLAPPAVVSGRTPGTQLSPSTDGTAPGTGTQAPSEAELVQQRRLSRGFGPGEGENMPGALAQHMAGVPAAVAGSGPGMPAAPSGLTRTQNIGGRGGRLEETLEGVEFKAASAGMLPDRDYLLTQGSILDCVLETRVISTVPGMTVCHLTRDIYSANGRVVLLDRGSKVVGRYHGGPQQGQARIFVLWTRVETPSGVVVELQSPGTGALGEAGLGGAVDTHFWDRFGAAILLSIIEDGADAAAARAAGPQSSAVTFTNQAAAGKEWCRGLWSRPSTSPRPWSRTRASGSASSWRATSTSGACMASSQSPVPDGKPGRDTALSQLLRPLGSFLGRVDVTEVAINRPGELWTRTRAGWAAHALPELSGEYLNALTTAMAVYGGLALRSMVSVVLPGGERGQIVRPPGCIQGMTPLTIRKHAPVVRTLAGLEEEGAFEEVRDVSFHMPSAEEAKRQSGRHDSLRLDADELELLALKRDRAFAEFLRSAVQHRKNIVIAGRTGSGKTTLARSIIEEVPTTERIVTIEDVHELALPNHPNRVHLMFGEGEGRVSASACLATCMRLSPDRILLAEVRGGEAWEYVASLNTGHPGSITTTHANGAVQAFERIAGLVKNSEAGRGLEIGEIRRALHSTLDVVLYMADRRVREVFYDPLFARVTAG